MSDDPPVEREPSYNFEVDTESAGQRLDAFLASHISAFSRRHIRRSIDEARCTVDGRVAKASQRLQVGQKIGVRLLPPPAEGPAPEPIVLDVLHEDDALIVVNKPPRMVVHPAKGHWAGTLVSAVMHRYGPLTTRGGENRPGIVHRLDRDTSGVIVIARTDAAHAALSKQFHDRTVKKAYLAVVVGHPDRDRDKISMPIGPHPSQRDKMALRPHGDEGRPAETFYEVLERRYGFALVRAFPKTGRTHQIRLHLLHAGHAVLCDRLYGGRAQLTAGEMRTIARQKRLAVEFPDEHPLIARQALHAESLELDHPTTGERMCFTAPLPADMERVVKLLRE